MINENEIQTEPEQETPMLVNSRYILIGDPKYCFDMFDQCLVKTSDHQPIPADEPIMIFRGQDNLAVAGAIKPYLEKAEDSHCGAQHTEAILDRIDEFEGFATAYPDRMKTPDTAVREGIPMAADEKTVDDPDLIK